MITTNINEHVLTITLNRADQHNAINRQMTQQLIQVWRDYEADSDLRVAIVTGSGQKSFCSGADLKQMGEFYHSQTPAERVYNLEFMPGLAGITRNLNISKPIIAAINGYCLGGGLELALACDIRICSENATFGAPEVKWGIMPGAGGTQRLPRIVGLSLAMEMLLTGERISAQRALTYGLVSQVVVKDQLLSTAQEIATFITNNGPLAVRNIKQAVQQGGELSLEQGLRVEQYFAEPLRQSEDAKEGALSFREKRTANFKGK